MPVPENDQITLAVLSQQIVTLTAEIQAMRMDMRKNSDSLTESRITQSRHDTEIKNLSADYDNLSARFNVWSIVNSVGVVGAAIIGTIFGARQP